MEKIDRINKCKNCGNNFPILEEDQEFYEIMEVPEPTLCCACRMQRRLAYRNERFLYHRKCGLSGKKVISSFSEDKPFPVYENDEWWSDKWDPLDYGREFDFKKPFFEQFFALRDKVPRLARQQQKPMWNSDYCNCVSQNRNCYLLFSTNRCEDCCYGSWVNDCKTSFDLKNVSGCELCYELTGCRDCYDLKYSQDCINCKNSYFLRDCIGCFNCFGCSNQHNKQYFIFNKKKTKQEYEKFIKDMNFGSYKVIQEYKEKIKKILNDLIVKEFHGINVENSVGDYLRNCKNAYICFECDDSEDIRYCNCIEKAKSSMDHSHWGVGTERIYECQACGYDLFNLRFCNLCWTGCSDLTYCDQCFSSQNCFGCVGLKKNKYCILNKQYQQNEYEELVRRIIEYMKKTPAAAGSLTGEWGEFFPINKSNYAYNETLAYEDYPLTREEVLKKGWQWKEKDPKEYLKQTYNISDDIKDIPFEIIKEILACEKCEKNYKIIEPEIKFYKKQSVPIPRKCPDCRHYERLALRTPKKLWDRNCQKCGKEIKTPYAPSRPEIVYCEKCYLATIV